MDINKFGEHLAEIGMSENTIRSYVEAMRQYSSQYDDVTTANIESWKHALTIGHSERTVNLRINAINAYLRYIKSSMEKIQTVKVQRKTYVERVISHSDYVYLKKRLAVDGHMMLHFAVWFMCASGARVSELLKITVEDVFVGHFEVKSKGGKIRRIYFPRPLCDAALKWLGSIDRRSGLVFLNRFGEPITARGLAREIKSKAARYGLASEVVHPHAFRHRFAINFLARHNDLALLADIMGHSSIETTRIYLRRSAEEQRRFLDAVVDW